MFTSQPAARRCHTARIFIGVCVGISLLGVPCSEVGGQATATADAASADWRAWAFGRLGPTKTSQLNNAIFASLGGGVAASYGKMLGIVRVTDNEYLSFDDNTVPGMRDYALLAGARSRGDHLFVAAAAGVAQATGVDARNANGTPNASRQLVLAFDLSAHADYRVAGLALSVSGALGPPTTRYIAISLGAELGWFGF